MPDICLRYMYMRFVLDMLQMNLVGICFMYTYGIYLRYAWYILEICLRYDLDISEIYAIFSCNICLRNMQGEQRNGQEGDGEMHKGGAERHAHHWDIYCCAIFPCCGCFSLNSISHLMSRMNLQTVDEWIMWRHSRRVYYYNLLLEIPSHTHWRVSGLVWTSPLCGAWLGWVTPYWFLPASHPD